MKGYLKDYKKKDNRMISAVVTKFSKFLAEKKQSKLLMKEFKTSIAEEFRDKLQDESKGEGRKSYFNRFRKIVSEAYKQKLLFKNPCENVDPPEGKAGEKDILTSEELQLIAQTPTNAPEVKRAFFILFNNRVKIL
jgi:integrase/recombinase XerD